MVPVACLLLGGGGMSLDVVLGSLALLRPVLGALEADAAWLPH